MRCLLFIVLLLCSILSFSQKKAVVTRPPFHKDKTDPAEHLFICNGSRDASTDMQKWRKYLMDNMALKPLSDTIPPGCYTAIIQFVIDTAGKIKDVTIVKDPGYGFGKIAAEVIAGYKELWHPAISDGKVSPSYRKQPVTVSIEKEEEEECQALPVAAIL
jgi:hypothetical protein